jgi:hypothetical protein
MSLAGKAWRAGLVKAIGLAFAGVAKLVDARDLKL